MINLTVCQPFFNHQQRGLLVVNTHMSRIEQTNDGKYALVVNGLLVLYTSSKTIADYYYAQACKHTSTSSNLYSIPIEQPLTVASSK